MNCNLDKPWITGLYVLCVGIAAIWLTAKLGTYQEGNREKYYDRVRPGAVTYGTHSTVTMPIISVPIRQGVPMVSRKEVRSYAHYGRSSMSTTSKASSSTSAGNGYRLFTTSGAQVQTGGYGSSAMSTASSAQCVSASGSRGISYSGTAVAMPSMAFAQLTGAATTATIASNIAATSRRMSVGARRTKPDYTGTGGVTVEKDGETWYWSDEEEDWVNVTPVGTVKEEDGYYWEWNGSAWVRKGEIADLGTPIGDAPWWLMLVLLLAYGVAKKVGFRRNNG